jgi:mono/diheme cytochrome c family protein
MRTALLTALFLAASFPAAAQDEAPRGNAANGAKLFVSLGCGACHGFEAQGSRDGPKLNPPPAFPVTELQIRQPRDLMPPFREKILSAQGMADIYAYLLSLPKPADVSRVRLLQEN